MFTRTNRGANTLTRRLIAAGVSLCSCTATWPRPPITDLRAFSDGEAYPLVATDTATRAGPGGRGDGRYPTGPNTETPVSCASSAAPRPRTR